MGKGASQVDKPRASDLLNPALVRTDYYHEDFTQRSYCKQYRNDENKRQGGAREIQVHNRNVCMHTSQTQQRGGSSIR